jgi:predicted site-specific integrase-resolvase
MFILITMKAKDVLRLLRIARPTLSIYVKKGFIRVEKLPNKQYVYSDEDIYKFLNSGIERETIIYARVSTTKQKKDLENQINLLKQYCFSKGYKINQIFSDVASGISFEKRKSFFEMLDRIQKNQVKVVVISYKDRLSRVGFDLFKYLFEKHGTIIEVMSENGDEKLDSQEIFEEIVSLLHCYSMKLYSKRKKNKIIISEK